MEDFDYELKIKNKKIIDFYKNHPSINFEEANLLLINFLDSLFNHITDDLDSNINSQILSYMNKTQTELNNIKDDMNIISDNVSKISSNTIDNINSQLMQLKGDYIDEMKILISTSNISTGDKLSSIIEKNNSFFLDKTTILLNDIIPKSQDSQHNHLKDMLQVQMNELYKQVCEETSKITTNSNGEQIMKSFLDSFETKHSSMIQSIQQPMFSYVSASEDRLNNNINSIKDLSTTSISTQKTVFDELSQFLTKYNASSNKGKYGENNLFSVLTSLYPSAEVQDTTGMKASGDFILKRLDKSPILVETKDYNHNINKDEIAKFIRDIDTQNMNGVFISQYSGISFKNNYHIDIHKGNVLLYLQNCEYSPDKIRVAIDMVDNLSSKIQELNMEETNNISKDILDDINQEYQVFISQRETLQTTIKDFHKKMNSQIDSLKFSSLDKYLDTKYAYVKERNFTCDICNAFTGTNKQSLSAHKRGCRKRNAATCIVAENSNV
tara:strand:+ start:140 stop:1630 length:1491 start_codon:yes stop_codon:yes gene_type:complete